MNSIVKLKIFAILTALLIGVGLLVFYYRKIKKHFQFRMKHLKELGIFYEKRKRFTDPNTKTVRDKVVASTLGIRKEQNDIVITKYNPAMAVPDFEKLKPNLEHILGIKIEHISSRQGRIPWRQAPIILHTESFKDVLSMSDCPKNLEPGQYWLGKTAIGEDLILDLRKGDFSLGIFSLAGGGKGNSIMTVASSFLDNWIRATGSHFYRVLILDAKGTDFHALVKKYPGTKSLNPIFLDELREAVAVLEQYKKEIDEYRKYLADNGITISHWLKIENKYPHLKPIPQPLLLIADELSQYMTPRPSLRITKDSTEEQIQLKEQYELEEKLAQLINSILQLFRSSGVFVILSNQTLKVEELTLQRTNIINFLLGRNSAQMSRLLVGDEKILTDTTLKAGRFIFSGNGHTIKVQVPFLLKDD
ncbi:MAG: hypothetical protein WA160_06775 [Pseudobdellovibrio sp.]